MASVFLSYDRDDAARARPVAAALERAGHSVWWDKHIGGGSQYAKEIEQALNTADVVVVLWSSSSVESPWVRDEAGSGRDRGRLVPLSLECTAPPLGFRQFQSIDLGAWKGRGRVPRLPEILSAIERQLKEPGIPAPGEATAVKPRRVGPSLNTWVLIAIGIGMFFVIVGLLIGRPWERSTSARIPSVAVAGTDSSPASQALAQAVSSKLTSLGDLASGKWQLVDAADRAQPDLILQAADANSKATLSLLSGKGHSALWSRDFEAAASATAALQEQVSLTAGRVLGCAAEGLNRGGKPLRQSTLKLYLTACSQLPEADSASYPSIAQGLRQVINDVPALRPAWSKLLLIESQGDVGPDGSDPSQRRALERDIEKVSQLDGKLPELAVARAALLPRRSYVAALKLLDDAHATSPENTNVLAARSQELLVVGRVSDAVADAAQAVALDPTSPDLLANYVLMLAYAGRVEAAKEQMQRARKLWSGTPRVRELQYGFQLRFGDPKDLLQMDEVKQAPPAFQLYVRTRINPSPANIDRFVAMLRQIHARRGVTAGDVAGHAQAYGEFHREEEIYRMIAEVPPKEDISLFSDVAFRPALRRFRQDPRFMAVAKRMGLLDYWEKSGKWPDFCFTDPDQPYDCKKEAAKLK